MQDYNKTDQILHLLCQQITKINASYVPKKADDSHTNLGYDGLNQRIYGRWISLNEDKIIAAIDLKNEAFIWMDVQMNIFKSYPIFERKVSDLEAEILRDLPEFGLDTAKYKQKLHFEIPAYDFADGIVPHPGTKGLSRWVTFRELANDASFMFSNFLQQQVEVRIWPHHFDTGVYAPINDKIGLGFGLAMQDDMVGEAYFYLAGYPSNDTEIDFEQFENLSHGNWIITDNWKGAVIDYSHLSSHSKTRLADFISEATTNYLINTH